MTPPPPFLLCGPCMCLETNQKNTVSSKVRKNLNEWRYTKSGLYGWIHDVLDWILLREVTKRTWSERSDS